jgi:hypothetical protein
LIYASAAAVLVALLAWDGWRRQLAGLRKEELGNIRKQLSHHGHLLEGFGQQRIVDALWEVRRDHGDHTTKAIEDVNEDFLGLKARIVSLESGPREPVDVTEFRAELDKHERALKNVIDDARETFATKAELVPLRANQGVTAASGNVGNGRMRMPLR